MGHDLKYNWTQPEDVRSISTLFNVVTAQYARTVAYWNWSNTDVPSGKSLSVVAKAGDRVVAHYSFMPLDFFVGDQVRTLGFGLQAVVQKEFRNFKTMKALTDMIFESARGKFPISYAFPNEEFFLVKTRLLGWDAVGTFCADVVKVQDILMKIQGNLAVKSLQSFPDLPWLNECLAAKICFLKSPALLNWRFIEHPINHYSILGAFSGTECIGYLVLKIYFRKEDNTLIGHFVDFDTKGKDFSIMSSLVHAGAEFFKFYGIQEIIFWNKEIHFKKFFQPLISSQAFKTNMGILIADKSLEDIACHLDNWSFTMAVSDAF